VSARVLPAVAIGVTVVLWSITYVLSGWALETGSAAVLSVGRFALTLVVLVPFTARRPGLSRALRDPRMILLGLLGVTLYYALANIGLLFTTAGTAALVASFMPVMTALAAVVLLRERIVLRTTVGLVLATAGVGLVAAAGFRIDLGVVLNLLALVAYSLYTVLLRREGGDGTGRDAITLATATAAWGTALMLPWLGWEIVTGTAAIPGDVRGLLGILAEGVVITAPALVLFGYAAQRLPAAVSGVATAAVPALGYGFALLLGEPFDLVKTIGGAVALVGVVIATLSQPDVEPSPAGSALPEPAGLAMRSGDPAHDVDSAPRRSTQSRRVAPGDPVQGDEPMKYMLIMRATQEAVDGYAQIDFEQVLNAMGAYNESLIKAGVMLAGEGLSDASEGAVVDFQADPPIVTDGPYGEIHELFNGFWILEVASKEEAIEWAKRCPLGPGNKLEVRRVHGDEDFAQYADNEYVKKEKEWRAAAEA